MIRIVSRAHGVGKYIMCEGTAHAFAYVCTLPEYSGVDLIWHSRPVPLPSPRPEPCSRPEAGGGTMAWFTYRIGAMFRETGIALDRLGCQLQGRASYAEERAPLPIFIVSPPAPPPPAPPLPLSLLHSILVL